MTERVLVAGIGNIFLGDDGFGVEVARRLAELDLPDWVRVGDYGIGGMHLAYDLAEGYGTAILIYATPRGGTPGSVYVLEPEAREVAAPDRAGTDSGTDSGRVGPGQAGAGLLAQPRASAAMFDAHGTQPDVVLGIVSMLGARGGRMLIVGCEPACTDYGIGLSEPVVGAVDAAVRAVLDLIAAHGR
ncbi:MAG: hydrogenase maturation protease [Streptosporangiaceae bacterium]